MKKVLRNNKKTFILNPKSMEVMKGNTNSWKLVICSYDDITEHEPSCTFQADYTYNLDGINPRNIIKTVNGVSSIIRSPIQGYYINTNNNIIGCSVDKCFSYRNYQNCGANSISSFNDELQFCGKYDSNTEKRIKINRTKKGRYMVFKYL